MSSLEWLGLWNNQLTTLPENIGDLSNLEKLWLYDNQLTSLPESIGNLSSLETLYLDGNQITSLPESICNIFSNISIDTFSASSNNICGTLPSCLTASDIGSQDCP